MQQNHGFIKDEIAPEDFVFGAARSIDTKFGGEVLRPDGDWRPCLFADIYSFQAPRFETNSCTSHGTLNAVELIRRMQFAYDQALSNRFVAKGSNTDPMRGNTPKTVAEYVRKNWTTFEREWSTESAQTVDEFYADIPQNLKTLAAARGAEWDFGYEWVTLTQKELTNALKYSPLGISVPAWFRDDTGYYYRPEGVSDSHWVCLMHIDSDGYFYILDSYPDDNGSYIKIMRPDFMPQVAMRYYVKRQIVNQDWFTTFLTWIHSWVFVSPEKPAPMPITEQKKTMNNQILFEVAESCLGADASPGDLAPDELGCAETCNAIHKEAFGDTIANTNILSTYWLYRALKERPDFVRVDTPGPGDIVISPTGYGTRKEKVPNGHVGIVGTENRIMSNDSATGTFIYNYTIETWNARYAKLGGYPVHFYRKL